MGSFPTPTGSGFNTDSGAAPILGVINAIPVIGPLLSGIASLFGFGGSDPVKGLANWTTSAFQAVGAWLSNVVDWALKSLLGVVKFLGMQIEGFFKGVFAKVFTLVDKVHNFLETHLRPLVDFIKKARALYDRYYKLYVRPFMNMLQHIRQVLGVLRALHISWAAKLDAQILHIESGINQLFSQVRTVLNGFIDILNSVIDPMSLIRHPTIVLSVRRTLNAMIKLGTGLPPGFFFPSPRKGVSKGLGFLPSNFVAGDSTMNPPASNYLGQDEGLGMFNGFTAGAIPDNSAVDDANPLDYFDDSLYDPGDCSDPASCLQRAMQLATQGQ